MGERITSTAKARTAPAETPEPARQRPPASVVSPAMARRGQARAFATRDEKEPHHLRRVTLTLDEQTIETGKALVDRYGPACSLSAITRRAISMLVQQWAFLEGRPRETAAERGAMAEFLAQSQRGVPLR